jgi:hypothetical protein
LTVFIDFTFLAILQKVFKININAAPKGDAKKVAERIIKFNFPRCQHVTTATRLPDGSIQAICRGIDYRVFTMCSAEKGQMLELGLNCKAAKKIGVSCYYSGN